MQISCHDHTGEAMQRVYENPKWTIGIKNVTAGDTLSEIDAFECHNGTDEQFILLSGGCSLAACEMIDGKPVFTVTRMEPFKVYSVPKTLYHRSIAQAKTRLLIVEDSGTSGANSRVLTLSEEMKEQLKAAVSKA
jgi:hypothetical protein